MNRVTIMAFGQALASSMSIPLEMIHAGSVIHALRRGGRNGLLLQTASEDGLPLAVTGGLVLQPSCRLADTGTSDLVFVPALWGNPRAALRRHPAAVAWLRQQYAAGATICSIGTGSYFLAEARLLDGRSATTHWRYFDDFEQRYPQVKLHRKRFITHEDRLYCTGSINAVRDVMQHFVEQLFSPSVADEVAHHFTHELKRSYESLALAGAQTDSHHDEEIIKIQEWMQRHYQQPVRLHELARRFGINIRSFNRRFRAAAGKTPMDYLQETRIAQAQELLKKSDLGIAEIAYAVGYQDAGYFSGLFRRLHAVSPQQYRKLVRNKMFNVEP